MTRFLAAEEPAAYVAELATTAGAAVRRLVDLPIPVIAAVSGAVAGRGSAWSVPPTPSWHIPAPGSHWRTIQPVQESRNRITDSATHAGLS